MKRALSVTLLLLVAGCSSQPTQPKPAPSLAANDTPAHAVSRLVGAYEQKSDDAYDGMFTGNFTFEFSTATDPTLAQQYATGWFKDDEKQSSSHLFHGYTLPGGTTLPAATSIHIVLANMNPVADSIGRDPVTHKVLATNVDGDVTVPQSGPEPLTYSFRSNYHVFYFVRGDSAVGLAASQPADSVHWYVYRWVDQTESPIVSPSRALITPPTWGKVKGLYR